MKQTSRGLAPSLNTGHSTFTGARQRLAVALVAIVIAFAGAQTAGADTGNPGDGVDYVDADGVVKNTATDGIDGNDTPTVITAGASSRYEVVNLSPGWYVVTGSNVEFKGSLQCSGAMHLILADGAKMTINCGKPGSNGMNISNGGLTIYGQSLGTGELYVPSSTRNGIYVNGGDIIINGGKVSATTTYANASGITNVENDIIINDGTVTVVGTQCGINGSKAVTINGGKVSATYTDGSSSGYGIFTESHQTITLGFRHEDDQIYVDKYGWTKAIVKVKDGQTLRDNDNAGNRYSGTISDVSAINGKTLTPVRTVAYIDGDGVTQQAEDFTMLTGSSANTSLPAGWYVVSGSDVNYSGRLESTSGDLHIILADGAKLTVGNALFCTGNLTIYGQSGGTGQLVANTIQTSSGLTINGGHISASTTYNQYAIQAGANGVTINGGIVSATATYSNRYGIATEGAITLGWRTASDRITASSYYAMGGVSVKAGQAFMNSDAAPAYLSGTISDMALIDGKTLRPINPADFELTATNEYTIKTADGWGVFCDLLSDYAKGIFTGKTVKLAADITVSRMAGSSDKPFTGTFDGQEHTLTASYSGSSYVAPFSYVDGATIQNLVVEGTISSSGTRAAGVIGETGSPGTTGKSYITNCVSSSTITGGNYSGGFSIGGNVEIEGCVFNGIINSDGNSGGFVGYSQSALTITNSLFAPQSGSSAKGTFYYNGTAGTLTNCYYTQTLGEGQGKQARTIKAGEGVTLGHDGVATEYSVSGITAYKSGDDFTSGILYDNVLYAGSGDAVSLTLANSATPAAEAPAGYQYSGDYSATGGATLSGSTLTMADEDVTVSFTPSDQLRSTGQAVLVSYINADGQPASHNAIALDGTETEIGQDGEETWYFVGADISYSDEINCYGNVNIILADGYTMTVSSDNAGIYGDSTLTIYGQTLGTGTLDITATNYGIDYGIVVIRGGTVNATGTNQDGIYAYSDATITGGKVTVTGNSVGIYSYEGNITITGGQVTATSNSVGIYSDEGNITLGCTNATDFIKATSYYVGDGKSVNIADGQTLYDEDGNEYIGDVFVYYDLAGKTLRPLPNVLALDDAADNSAAITANDRETRNVILYGRTLYKDGAWNTLCLPFALGDDQAESGHELDGTPLEGATLMTLGNSQACNTGFDPQTGTLNLDFLPATTVEPGVAYIVKWPIPDGMTPDEFADAYAANPDAYDLKNPVFTGVTVTNDAPADHATTSLDGYVTFVGTYGPAAIYADPATALYLGAANKLYWPTATDFELKPFRAYFQLNNGLTAGTPSSPKAVRAFSLNFGDDEATGIVSAEANSSLFTLHSSLSTWFTLDGRRLQAKPSAPGIYVNNGKKVVIK